MKNKIIYPVYEPLLGGNEIKYVIDCIESTWISGKGAYLDRFESAFSKYIGVKKSTAVCNGTVALHLALEALGIGEGDEIIVPTLTYVASVNSITYTGATPVFVDCDADTWQISVEDVEKKITGKTRGIMCVHLYGQACNMDDLVAISKKRNLFLIEDCAEAIGTLYNNKHVGSFGDIATFSFYGNKTITTGEGGMVVTNNETLHERVLHLKGQGLAKYREYWHDAVGYNYRMTNVSAAIGLAQFEQLEDILSKKKNIAQWYSEAFSDSPFEFHSESENTVHSYWMCTILVPDTMDRDELRDHLAANGIETRPIFYPVHTMPIYAQKFEKHPISEMIARRGINLPSYPALTKEDVSHIVDKIFSFGS